MAESFNSRGEIYASLGDYAEAESLFRQALIIYDKIIGTESQATALVLHNYANVLKNLGKEAEAKVLEERSVNLNAR